MTSSLPSALYDRNRLYDFTRGYGKSAEGARCERCKATEAGCAYLYGSCCAACTHWREFTADGEYRMSSRLAEVSPRIVGNCLQSVSTARETKPTNNTAPVKEAATSTGAATRTIGELVAQSWLDSLPPSKPERCAVCGRKTPFRQDGTRIRHRVEVDNPLAPYCLSDDEAVA